MQRKGSRAANPPGRQRSVGTLPTPMIGWHASGLRPGRLSAAAWRAGGVPFLVFPLVAHPWSPLTGAITWIA